MTFPITYLLDHSAPSETFIRRELDQLQRRNWPVYKRQLKNGDDVLKFSLNCCPEGFRWRFSKAAWRRIKSECSYAPVHACRIFRRLPQAAYLIKKLIDSDSWLIHAQFAGITCDLAAIAAETVGIPWTCAVHAHDIFTASPQAVARRLRTADAVVACSQLAADTVLNAGVAAEKVSVIHHGLPINDFPFDTIQPDETLFCACRLEPKKGIDILLHACAILLKRGVHFTCTIAGTGPCYDDLVKMCGQLGLEQTVFFTGWLSGDETRSRMIDSSMLVLPSRRTRNGDRDGIANILIEAMALGTPVVTTTAGAAGEVITDNVNGLLVPPDDPVALADALAKGLACKELLIRLAKSARTTAVTLFDGSKNIGQLETLFKRVAEPPV